MKRKIIIVYFVIALFVIVQFNVIANNPPEKPTIIGPKIARINKICNFSVVSNDPECDNIGYGICSWGDGSRCNYSIGLFPSGEEINIEHIWNEKGTYQITICAIDCHGACSDFTEYEIRITKNKLLPFLENFNRLYHLYQNIIANNFCVGYKG